MGKHHFCTVQQAEELAHAAYLLGRKEEAKARHEMAVAFEARIMAFEARIPMAGPYDTNGHAMMPSYVIGRQQCAKCSRHFSDPLTERPAPCDDGLGTKGLSMPPAQPATPHD